MRSARVGRRTRDPAGDKVFGHLSLDVLILSFSCFMSSLDVLCLSVLDVLRCSLDGLRFRWMFLNVCLSLDALRLYLSGLTTFSLDVLSLDSLCFRWSFYVCLMFHVFSHCLAPYSALQYAFVASPFFFHSKFITNLSDCSAPCCALRCVSFGLDYLLPGLLCLLLSCRIALLTTFVSDCFVYYFLFGLVYLLYYSRFALLTTFFSD